MGGNAHHGFTLVGEVGQVNGVLRSRRQRVESGCFESAAHAPSQQTVLRHAPLDHPRRHLFGDRLALPTRASIDLLDVLDDKQATMTASALPC